MEDQIADLPRQKQRKARKDAGLPASEDVAALSCRDTPWPPHRLSRHYDS